MHRARRTTTPRFATVGLCTMLVAASIAVGVAPAGAADDRPEAAITAFQVEPLNPTSRVVGSDGLTHLAYELEIAVLFPKVVTFESVEALDPADGDNLVATFDAATIASTLNVFGAKASATIPAGGGGILFLDVALPEGASVPRRLEHRFTYTLADPGGEPGAPQTFIGAPVAVSPKQPIVVAPPLRGKHWVVGNGCCAEVTAHRGATLPIDGTIHVPERFAIDFVQLDDQNKLFDGPVEENESYGYYDDAIYSVAPGTVVAVQDGLPDQIPGELDPNATVHTAGGNYVVVDLGRGHFAFYAHMIPDSITVKEGDTVTTGEVLGKLGNSGNTDGAHLHFHIMDGPSPLLANGLPFEFTRFVGEGKVTTPVPDVQHGATAEIDDVNVGPHRNALPLNLEMIAFAGRE